MFCIKCGKELREDQQFCPFCGLKVGETEFTREDDNPCANQMNQQGYQSGAQNNQCVNNTGYNPDRNENNNAFSKGTLPSNYVGRQNNNYQNYNNYNNQQTDPYGNFMINNMVKEYTFIDGIKDYFKGYIDFDGRATRAEFWYSILFNFIVVFTLYVAECAMYAARFEAGYFAVMVVNVIFLLSIILPWIAVSIRRFHDTGRSGIWMLILLIPVFGWAVYILTLCLESDSNNEFGPQKL